MQGDGVGRIEWSNARENAGGNSSGRAYMPLQHMWHVKSPARFLPLSGTRIYISPALWHTYIRFSRSLAQVSLSLSLAHARFLPPSGTCVNTFSRAGPCRLFQRPQLWSTPGAPPPLGVLEGGALPWTNVCSAGASGGSRRAGLLCCSRQHADVKVSASNGKAAALTRARPDLPSFSQEPAGPRCSRPRARMHQHAAVGTAGWAFLTRRTPNNHIMIYDDHHDLW